MSNQKQYAVTVQLFGNYSTWYFLNADEEGETQFFEQVTDDCKCTWAEARELCAKFARRYPGRKFQTVSKIYNYERQDF